jgi:hypothetical protein
MIKGDQDLEDDHSQIKKSDKAKKIKELSDRTVSEIDSNQ